MNSPKSFFPALCSAVVLAASCAPNLSPPKVAPAASSSASPIVSSPPKPVEKPSVPRPPPPMVRVARPGDPSGTDLAQARLLASDCDSYRKLEESLIEGRIRQMRQELDNSYRSWRASQQACWEQYRWQEEQSRAGSIWGTGSGYGSGGGLGLSGIGEGGGGTGHSINLRYASASVNGASAPQVRMGATSVSGRSTPSRPASSAKGAQSASRTNNQVEGVDEADIVKNDGKFVYIGMNGALRIVEALNPRLVSLTRIPGNVKEIFVENDRAVVYTASGKSAPRCTYGYDCVFAGDGSSTKVLVLDIADRANPKIIRQIELSGSLMAARRIGSTIHTVVADNEPNVPTYSSWPDGMESCGVRESVVRAKFAALRLENERRIRERTHFPSLRDNGAEKNLCSGLYRTAIEDGQAFTTLVSFDLEGNSPPTTATVQSRPGAVFASSDSLYMSVVHHRNRRQGKWYSFYASEDEASEIHKFKIGSKPSDTRYSGSGVVPGHVLNQFSMDEWYGYLRIATSTGRVPSPKVESTVSILATGDDSNLVRVGAVEHIAPGEDIRAVRFDGDRGYVVTFKKTDPLFVIDLYNPSNPAILGELKIPGFSTYMHRIDPDHLLSIGFDANDHGDFAYFDGVILQLFDVSNPTDPKLLHKEKIGTRGSSSEAATNHLAFNYFAEKGMLAIPMTICEGGGDGSNGNELAFSGLLVYDVSVESGFKRLGGINHGTRGVSCSTWWSNANSAVKRSIFLDDLVYSIATDRLKVQRLGNFGADLANIPLMP